MLCLAFLHLQSLCAPPKYHGSVQVIVQTRKLYVVDTVDGKDVVTGPPDIKDNSMQDAWKRVQQ